MVGVVEGGARIEVEGKDLWSLRAVPSDAAVRVTYGPYEATGCALETDSNVALRCTSVPGYGKDLAVEVRIGGAVVAHEAGVATISHEVPSLQNATVENAEQPRLTSGAYPIVLHGGNLGASAGNAGASERSKLSGSAALSAHHRPTSRAAPPPSGLPSMPRRTRARTPPDARAR